jgi:phosphoribosyl-AMP cyclohydrolase
VRERDRLAQVAAEHLVAAIAESGRTTQARMFGFVSSAAIASSADGTITKS